LENLKGEIHLADLDVDGRILLELISEKKILSVWNGFN
jgi:hypothetical protein